MMPYKDFVLIDETIGVTEKLLFMANKANSKIEKPAMKTKDAALIIG